MVETWESRRTQVLERAAQGLTNAQIAESLSLSRSTIKRYKRLFLNDDFEVNHRLIQTVVEGIQDGSVPRPDVSPDISVTKRMNQVGKLVQGGATNSQIAEVLQLSERTVNGHVSRLRDKFGASNKVALAAMWTSWELSPKDPEDKIWRNPEYVKILNNRANGLEWLEIAENLYYARSTFGKHVKKMKKIKDPSGTGTPRAVYTELVKSGVKKGLVHVQDVPDDVSFTPLEQRISDLLLMGKDAREIADDLSYSMRYIKRRIGDLYAVVHAKNVYHFVGIMATYALKKA